MCVKLLKLTGVLKKPQSDLCAEHVQKQSLITPDACICNKTVPKYSVPLGLSGSVILICCLHFSSSFVIGILEIKLS